MLFRPEDHKYFVTWVYHCTEDPKIFFPEDLGTVKEIMDPEDIMKISIT